MYVLKNDQLEVQIIDPIKDMRLLGSRYCTGGYIFQVKDLKKGNLFSGPQYPRPNFDVFHGQGAPEVFVTALNQEQCEVGQEVYVIGVGSVRRTSPAFPFHVRDNPHVKEFCEWEIAEIKNCLKMASMIVFDRWNFSITKIITLNYRTVSSQTTIMNIGKEIPILWFAHPFFPVSDNPMKCKLSTPINIDENEGYLINNEGFIETKSSYDWKKGLYQKIAWNKKETLSAIHCHPFIDKVSITCDFIPESVAIWANDITFSFEPFYKATIESDGIRTWGISYCF